MAFQTLARAAFGLLIRWRYLAWRGRILENPWGLAAVGVLVLFLAGNAVFLGIGFQLFYQALADHGLSPKAYAGLPVAIGGLYALVAASLRTRPALARLWLVETAPLPRWLVGLDRALSALTTQALVAGPVLWAALHYAGYPAWAGLPLLLLAGIAGALIRPFALPSYLVAAGAGFALGWMQAYVLKLILNDDLLFQPYFDPDLAEAHLWALVAPLVGHPLNPAMQEALSLGAVLALPLSLLLLFPLVFLFATPVPDRGLSPLAAAAWRAASWIPRAPLAYALQYLFHQLDQALGQVAGFLGLALGLRHQLAVAAPFYPSVWTALVLFWSPVLSSRGPLPGVLGGGNRETVALRGGIEALALSTLLLGGWVFPVPAALGLWLVLGLAWKLSPKLARFPALASGLLWLLGGGTLWLFR